MQVIIFTVALASAYCQEHGHHYTIKSVQHEHPHEYHHHEHLRVHNEPAPIHEAQSSESYDHGQGQGVSDHHLYTNIGHLQSQKSEEEYAPVYQYVQAQHEPSHHAAPVHTQQIVHFLPKHQSSGHESHYSHEPVSFHHGVQLQAPAHHQAESHSQESHEEPVDYYVSLFLNILISVACADIRT